MDIYMELMDAERKKKVKKLRTVIYGRTLVVLLAVFIQFLLLFAAGVWLRTYSLYIYAIFMVVSMLVVMHLYSDRTCPDLKLVWMLPIAIFPIFGGIFYLFIELQAGTHFLQKKLKILHEDIQKIIHQNVQPVEEIRKKDPHVAALADYLYKYNNSPTYSGSNVKYYSLGDYHMEDICNDLRSAEKFIFLEYFIVEEGEMWDSVLEILVEKAKAGVEVKFMYDGMCSLSLLPTTYPKTMSELGIECKVFSQIHPIFSSSYNNRDHRKILCIDGKIAYTGGINMADEYINKKVRFGHWKDIGIRVTGEAAQRFVYMFLKMWNVYETEKVDYGKYLTKENIAMESDGFCIPYDVNPYSVEHVGKRVYLDILNTATKYVHIMTPYLIIDYETIYAICYAAKRGVDVKIILPHIPDKKYAFILAKTYYAELIEAGVEIYEYTPGFVHAKLFVADDDKAVVGTVNLDYRSFYHHFECGVYMYQNSQIACMEEDYQDTLSKSMKVTMEQVNSRSLAERFAGRILKVIAPLM